jgi:predicted alpha/beta-fold hydrolase
VHTPDGDFVDIDWMDPPRCKAAPERVLVLFHGLEGSSASHYARALAGQTHQLGWCLAVPHFRGCSGQINLAPRAYHSGDWAEIDWMLRQVHNAVGEAAELMAVGVSLGGNALLRWAAETGAAPSPVRAIAAVCAPLDLAASAAAISRGFGRWSYTPMFLRTMKPKALAKWAQFPGLFDRDRLLAARTLEDFDDVFTAPLHGFVDAADYWGRCSAGPHLHRIRIPALVLNPRDDPFVPEAVLPRQVASACVRLWQPSRGGHVGFASGRFPGSIRGLSRVLTDWLERAGHG